MSSRETAVSERERNIGKKEKDIQDAADKKLKEQTSQIRANADERADNEIESFRNRYSAIFIVISLICGAQLLFNALTPVDHTVLQARWEQLVETIKSIPTWSYQRMGITAVITIAILIFFGYQYLKRFRDELTLFVFLADVTVIEYFAPHIVASGISLFAAFGIIQIVYFIIRDLSDENSGIKGFIDLMTGNR